jgi:hypothetical protein
VGDAPDRGLAIGIAEGDGSIRNQDDGRYGHWASVAPTPPQG